MTVLTVWLLPIQVVLKVVRTFVHIAERLTSVFEDLALGLAVLRMLAVVS